MMPDFKLPNRKQLFLLPPSIQEWLPEDHLARFVVEIVEQLDISAISRKYNNKGTQAYSPAMLVALLFYGYATGIFSSRKLERATHDSVAVRFVAANTHPDHDTIANFRRRFHAEIAGLFHQVLLLAHEAGVLRLGTVSLDGSKVKANASKHKALSYQYANKLEEHLRVEIAELLSRAERADQADLPDGMNLPEELCRREQRLAVIAKAKAEIERRAAARQAIEQQEYAAKVAEREDKAKKSGKKPRGKGPTPPSIGGPTGKDQVNLTDAESRIMPKGKDFEQAYNAQASVDTDSMLIVAQRLTQHSNDKAELEPMLEQLAKLPQSLGHVNNLLADAGFFSEQNVRACVAADIVPYIACERQKHNESVCSRFVEPSYPCPEAKVDPVGNMRYQLRTKVGRALYAVRKSTVEPVFGILKAVLGFRQFSLRGLKLASAEWGIVCTAWNIKRFHRLVQAS
jgi:transposase